jgi:hypothetical protein
MGPNIPKTWVLEEIHFTAHGCGGATSPASIIKNNSTYKTTKTIERLLQYLSKNDEKT